MDKRIPKLLYWIAYVMQFVPIPYLIMRHTVYAYMAIVIGISQIIAKKLDNWIFIGTVVVGISCTVYSL